jgi:PAS domain S-box-containing protein
MQIGRDERADALELPFREWLARIPGTVYVQHGSGIATTVYISPRVEELVGRPASTFTGLDDVWSTLVHPEDQARLHEADLQADLVGSFHCEYRLLVADGTYRWMRDEAHRQPDSDVWIGMLIDIDDQKRTEEELRAAVGRFQTLVEQVPTVI